MSEVDRPLRGRCQCLWRCRLFLARFQNISFETRKKFRLALLALVFRSRMECAIHLPGCFSRPVFFGSGKSSGRARCSGFRVFYSNLFQNSGLMLKQQRQCPIDFTHHFLHPIFSDPEKAQAIRHAGTIFRHWHIPGNGHASLRSRPGSGARSRRNQLFWLSFWRFTASLRENSPLRPCNMLRKFNHDC